MRGTVQEELSKEVVQVAEKRYPSGEWNYKVCGFNCFLFFCPFQRAIDFSFLLNFLYKNAGSELVRS